MKTKWVILLAAIAAFMTAVVAWQISSGVKPAAQAPAAPPPAAPAVSAPAAVEPATVAAAPLASPTSVTADGLTMDLPAGWVVQNIEPHQEKSDKYQGVYEDNTYKWEVAKIKVPDPQYNVVIPVEVAPYPGIVDETTTLLATSPAGTKVYGDACAPSLACYIVMTANGMNYHVTFEEPESDQPVPANLDGVWFPDTTVTADEALSVVATAR